MGDTQSYYSNELYPESEGKLQICATFVYRPFAFNVTKLNLHPIISLA